MSDKHAYEELEARLNRLVERLADVLSGEERRKVLEFVDAAEYGVALETLCAIVVEEEKELPEEAFREASNLAKKMGIEKTLVTSEFRKRVRDGS